MSLNCCRRLGRSQCLPAQACRQKAESPPSAASRAGCGHSSIRNSLPHRPPTALTRRSYGAGIAGVPPWSNGLSRMRDIEPSLCWKTLKPGLVVVTQNVDDLHERAGSRDVVHLHGSLFSLRCFACERAFTGAPSSAADTPQPALRVEPPKCLRCGGPVRPGVVWFGEQLPEKAWGRAERLMEDCDVLLVIGTSGVVQPAASLPRSAKQRGVPVVEVNPEASAITPVADIFNRAKAADALPRIAAALEARRDAENSGSDGHTS